MAGCRGCWIGQGSAESAPHGSGANPARAGARATIFFVRGRNSAGMMARAVRPTDHQNALSNAAARPTRPPEACAAICVSRIMAMTAAPNAPPTCDVIRVAMLACGTWSGRKPR